MKKAFIACIFLGLSLSSFAQNSGDLENKFYFHFGYSQPTKSFFGVSDNSIWDQLSRGGVVFELGQIFMLNSIPLTDGLRIGINVDYAEISYNQLLEESRDSGFGIFKISSKVGPSISYSPVADLVFDAFFKLKIPLVAGLAYISDNYDATYAGLLGIGYSTGFNVRYRFIMAGFEFNTDKMKLEDSEEPGEYFGTLSWVDQGADKTPMPSFSFTFGFCF